MIQALAIGYAIGQFLVLLFQVGYYSWGDRQSRKKIGKAVYYLGANTINYPTCIITSDSNTDSDK